MPPTSFVAGHDQAPGRRRASSITLHDRLRVAAAISIARHHFLPDETAFLEIDAVELVHVGFMREGVAIDEIDAARGTPSAMRCAA